MHNVKNELKAYSSNLAQHRDICREDEFIIFHAEGRAERLTESDVFIPIQARTKLKTNRLTSRCVVDHYSILRRKLLKAINSISCNAFINVTRVAVTWTVLIVVSMKSYLGPLTTEKEGWIASASVGMAEARYGTARADREEVQLVADVRVLQVSESEFSDLTGREITSRDGSVI